MDKPRVLVFIDWYLPGYKAGGPVRSLANMVDHLRDRIDFNIVTRNTEYTGTTPYPGVEYDRWTTLPGGERVWYASKEGTSRKAWKRILKEEPWDTIYVNGLYSWWYNILPLWLSRGAKAKRVVAVRGMLAAGAIRQGALKKLLFLSVARLFDLYRGVLFQATKQDEVDDIRKLLLHRAKVAVAPNLPRMAAAHQAPIGKEPGALKLVSIARIAPEKNTLLAIESLEATQCRVDFNLYGPVYDRAYWAKCLRAIDELPERVQVTHHGAIPPNEVPGMLAAHHALFMPSAGENFGHTMLEALCTGRPLLISDRTPWKQLEAAHAGWDLPLDDKRAFTSAVDRLCNMDQAGYDQWAQGAFAMGKRYLADTSIGEASFKLLQP